MEQTSLFGSGYEPTFAVKVGTWEKINLSLPYHLRLSLVYRVNVTAVCDVRSQDDRMGDGNCYLFPF